MGMRSTVTDKLVVVVAHSSYGCDTGCCGHYVEINGEQVGRFHFEHPYGEDAKTWATEFAREIVEEKFGKAHAFDLDWENSRVSDD